MIQFINAGTAHALHEAARSEGSIVIWTVMRETSDIPHPFCARAHIVRGNKSLISQSVVIGKTIDEVRAKIPPGLHKIARASDDNAVIVETWL